MIHNYHLRDNLLDKKDSLIEKSDIGFQYFI